MAEWAESRDDQRLDSVIVHLQQAVSAVRRARGEPGSSEPYESSPAGMADAHADGQHAESPREGVPGVPRPVRESAVSERLSREERIERSRAQLLEWAETHHPAKMAAAADLSESGRVVVASRLWSAGAWERVRQPRRTTTGSAWFLCASCAHAPTCPMLTDPVWTECWSLFRAAVAAATMPERERRCTSRTCADDPHPRPEGFPQRHRAPCELAVEGELRQLLCLECAERALGRQLDADDLAPCVGNYGPRMMLDRLRTAPAVDGLPLEPCLCLEYAAPHPYGSHGCLVAALELLGTAWEPDLDDPRTELEAWTGKWTTTGGDGRERVVDVSTGGPRLARAIATVVDAAPPLLRALGQTHRLLARAVEGSLDRERDRADLERLRSWERSLLELLDETRWTRLWLSVPKATPAKIFEELAGQYLEQQDALTTAAAICSERGFDPTQCPSDAVRGMANSHEEISTAARRLCALLDDGYLRWGDDSATMRAIQDLRATLGMPPHPPPEGGSAPVEDLARRLEAICDVVRTMGDPSRAYPAELAALARLCGVGERG